MAYESDIIFYTHSKRSLKLPDSLDFQEYKPTKSEKTDIIVLGEFSEIEGPIPLITIPENVSATGSFDVNQFVLELMCSDFQDLGSTNFHVYKDTCIAREDALKQIHSYVHYFTLFDVRARGYVRPMCLAYVSRCALKIRRYKAKLKEYFGKATEYLRVTNLELFKQELHQRIEDLTFTKIKLLQFQKEILLSCDKSSQKILKTKSVENLNISASEDENFNVSSFETSNSSFYNTPNVSNFETLNFPFYNTTNVSNFETRNNSVLNASEVSYFDTGKYSNSRSAKRDSFKKIKKFSKSLNSLKKLNHVQNENTKSAKISNSPKNFDTLSFPPYKSKTRQIKMETNTEQTMINFDNCCCAYKKFLMPIYVKNVPCFVSPCYRCSHRKDLGIPKTFNDVQDCSKNKFIQNSEIISQKSVENLHKTSTETFHRNPKSGFQKISQNSSEKLLENSKTLTGNRLNKFGCDILPSHKTMREKEIIMNEERNKENATICNNLINEGTSENKTAHKINKYSNESDFDFFVPTKSNSNDTPAHLPIIESLENNFESFEQLKSRKKPLESLEDMEDFLSATKITKAENEYAENHVNKSKNCFAKYHSISPENQEKFKNIPKSFENQSNSLKNHLNFLESQTNSSENHPNFLENQPNSSEKQPNSSKNWLKLQEHEEKNLISADERSLLKHSSLAALASELSNCRNMVEVITEYLEENGTLLEIHRYHEFLRLNRNSELYINIEKSLLENLPKMREPSVFVVTLMRKICKHLRPISELCRTGFIASLVVLLECHTQLKRSVVELFRDGLEKPLNFINSIPPNHEFRSHFDDSSNIKCSNLAVNYSSVDIGSMSVVNVPIQSDFTELRYCISCNKNTLNSSCNPTKLGSKNSGRICNSKCDINVVKGNSVCDTNILERNPICDIERKTFKENGATLNNSSKNNFNSLLSTDLIELQELNKSFDKNYNLASTSQDTPLNKKEFTLPSCLFKSIDNKELLSVLSEFKFEKSGSFSKNNNFVSKSNLESQNGNLENTLHSQIPENFHSQKESCANLLNSEIESSENSFQNQNSGNLLKKENRKNSDECQENQIFNEIETVEAEDCLDAFCEEFGFENISLDKENNNQTFSLCDLLYQFKDANECIFATLFSGRTVAIAGSEKSENKVGNFVDILSELMPTKLDSKVKTLRWHRGTITPLHLSMYKIMGVCIPERLHIQDLMSVQTLNQITVLNVETSYVSGVAYNGSILKNIKHTTKNFNFEKNMAKITSEMAPFGRNTLSTTYKMFNFGQNSPNITPETLKLMENQIRANLKSIFARVGRKVFLYHSLRATSDSTALHVLRAIGVVPADYAIIQYFESLIFSSE